MHKRVTKLVSCGVLLLAISLQAAQAEYKGQDEKQQAVHGYACALQEKQPKLLIIERTQKEALGKKSKDRSLGFKVALQPFLQRPLTIADQKKFLADFLAAPQKMHMPTEEYEEKVNDIGGFKTAENLSEQVPFWIFSECDCVPRLMRTQFSDLIVDQLVKIYKDRKGNGSFVYTTFASGDLFSDLYILTKFVTTLKEQGIRDIRLTVNLIDILYKDYVKNLNSYADESDAIPFDQHEHTTYLLAQFLRWFTQNLGIKMDLYIYRSGHEYIYDLVKVRVDQTDVIVAADYYWETMGDLAQLVSRALKLNGYFFSAVQPSKMAAMYTPESLLLEELPESEFDDLDFLVVQKTKALPDALFKDLLKKTKADDKKIARLFVPLFYRKQFKGAFFEHDKAVKTFKFNPLDYFTIVMNKNYVYRMPAYKHEPFPQDAQNFVGGAQAQQAMAQQQAVAPVSPDVENQQRRLP